jgi:ATP adenylyltransferase
MRSEPDAFEPARLLPRARAVARRARDVGALSPIATTCTEVEERGLPFQVMVVQGLARKLAAQTREPAGFDPFLPYDPALFVADLSPTHVCLLNKYSVIDDHLLVVTRAFEDQGALLTRADFEALARCLDGADGLAFYNSGPVAGASQRHKHLQLVPALGPADRRAPIEAAVIAALPPSGVGTVPALPFAHAGARIDAAAGERPEALRRCYAALLAAVDRAHPGAAYNLLATRDWMLAVPRVRERWDGVSINALGFAGALLVKSDVDLDRVRRAGPAALLAAVAGAAPG